MKKFIIIILVIIFCFSIYYFVLPKNCIQVMVSATNRITRKSKVFGTPCNVPFWYKNVISWNSEYAFPNPEYEDTIRKTTKMYCTPTAAPSIIIISPIEGQTHPVSKENIINRNIIKWVSCNIKDVYISLANGGHDMGLLSETPILAELGAYEWNVPDTSSENYKILVKTSSEPYVQAIVNFKVQ